MIVFSVLPEIGWVSAKKCKQTHPIWEGFFRDSLYESPLCVLLKILMQLLFVSPRGAARVADGGQDPALRVDDDDDDSAVCGCH